VQDTVLAVWQIEADLNQTVLSDPVPEHESYVMAGVAT